MCSKREPFHVLLPLLRHVAPLNDGNCRLTMPVGKGRCARDALPHAFHIGVFKFVFIRPFEKRTYYAMVMSVRPSVRTKITLYEEDKKEEASMRCSLLHGS